jgi:hypothetical protein
MEPLGFGGKSLSSTLTAVCAESVSGATVTD